MAEDYSQWEVALDPLKEQSPALAGMKYLTQIKGWEPHHAAGAVGNLYYESNEMDPTAVGDKGQSLGLGQWNGPRLINLQNFAAKRGVSPTDFLTQLDFVDWELNNTESKALAALKQTNNARDAAIAFSNEYERPGKPALNSRVSLAEKFYNEGGYAPGTAGYRAPQRKPGAAAPATPEVVPDVIDVSSDIFEKAGAEAPSAPGWGTVLEQGIKKGLKDVVTTAASGFDPLSAVTGAGIMPDPETFEALRSAPGTRKERAEVASKALEEAIPTPETFGPWYSPKSITEQAARFVPLLPLLYATGGYAAPLSAPLEAAMAAEVAPSLAARVAAAVGPPATQFGLLGAAEPEPLSAMGAGATVGGLLGATGLGAGKIPGMLAKPAYVAGGAGVGAMQPFIERAFHPDMPPVTGEEVGRGMSGLGLFHLLGRVPREYKAPLGLLDATGELPPEMAETLARLRGQLALPYPEGKLGEGFTMREPTPETRLRKAAWRTEEEPIVQGRDLTEELAPVKEAYEEGRITREAPTLTPEESQAEVSRMIDNYRRGLPEPILEDALPKETLDAIKKGQEIKPEDQTKLRSYIEVGVPRAWEARAAEEEGVAPLGNAPRLGNAPLANAPSKQTPGPIWYSKMSKFFERSLPGRGKPEELTKLIQGWSEKGGFSRDELKWSGLIPWLQEQQGPVTKQQLMDKMAENQTRIGEVWRGGENADLGGAEEKIRRAQQELTARLRESQDADRELRFIEDGAVEAIARGGAGSSTARSFIRNPDASRVVIESYYPGFNFDAHTAALRRFDEARRAAQESQRAFEAAQDEYRNLQSNFPEVKYGQYTLGYNEAHRPGGTNNRELLLTLPVKEGEEYFTGSHWPDPNVVVHARINDRIDSEGKKTLFIEEIQSDWHQRGRKKGYKDEEYTAKINDLTGEMERIKEEIKSKLEDPEFLRLKEASDRAYKALNDTIAKRDEAYNTKPEATVREMTKMVTHARDKYYNASALVMEKEQELTGSLADRKDAIENEFHQLREGAYSKVPAAPFSKTWPELMMRRLVRYAAEHGYDRVAWTTGEHQWERWGSERIDWKRQEPGQAGKLPDELMVTYTSGPEKLRWRDIEGTEDSIKAETDHGNYYIDYDPDNAKYFVDTPFGAGDFSTLERAKEMAEKWYNEEIGDQEPGFLVEHRDTGKVYTRNHKTMEEATKAALEIPEVQKLIKGGWRVSALEQERGMAGGVNIEEDARRRGVLLEQSDQLITSKEDLQDIINRTMNRELTDTEMNRLTDRLWERMQSEAEGTMRPRKEGMESFYDKMLRDYTAKFGKQWGAKVTDSKISRTGERESLGEVRYEEGADLPYSSYDLRGKLVGRFKTEEEAFRSGKIKYDDTVHGLDITPDMRQSVVTQGVQLYNQPRLGNAPPPGREPGRTGEAPPGGGAGGEGGEGGGPPDSTPEAKTKEAGKLPFFQYLKDAITPQVARGIMKPIEGAQRFVQAYFSFRRNERVRANIELNKFIPQFGAMSPQQFKDFLRTEVAPYQETGAISEALRPILEVYDRLRLPFEEFMQEHHPEALRENYFREMFKRPKEGWDKWFELHPSAYWQDSLMGSRGFLRQKKYGTWQEGLEAGLEPRANNLVDLIKSDLAQKNQYMYGWEVTKALKDMGIVKALPSGQKLPDGWRYIEGPGGRYTYKIDRPGGFMIPEKALEEVTPMGGGEERTAFQEVPKVRAHAIGGHYIAEKSVANYLNGQFSPGLIATLDKTISNPILREAAKIAAKGFVGGTNLLRMVEVFGPWHMYVTDNHFRSIVAGNVPADLLATALGKDVVGDVGKGMARALLPGSSLLARRISKDIQDAWFTKAGPEWAQEAAFNILEAGGNINADPRKVISNLMKGSDEYGNILKDGVRSMIQDVRAGKPLKAVDTFAAGLSAPIMKYLVPDVKIATHYLLTKIPMDKLREKYNVTGIGKDARTADPSLQSEFVTERMRLNQDTWKFVDYTFGQIPRENVKFSNVMKDILNFAIQFPTWNIGTLGLMGEAGKGVVKAAAGGPQTTMSASAMKLAAGLFITQGISGALLHRAMNGSWPTTLGDLYTPVVDKDLEERAAFPGYLKTGRAFYHEPFRSFFGMKNHVLSMLDELYNNVDFNGTLIRTPDAGFSTQAKELGQYFMENRQPFMLQQMERGESPLAKYGSIVGVTRAPKYFSATPADRVMTDYRQVHPLPKRSREDAELGKVKKQVADLMIKGKTDEAIEKIKPIIEKEQIPPERAAQWLEDAGKDPKLLRFQRLPLDWQIKAMMKANARERELWEPLLIEKISNSNEFVLQKNMEAIEKYLAKRDNDHEKGIWGFLRGE